MIDKHLWFWTKSNDVGGRASVVLSLTFLEACGAARWCAGAGHFRVYAILTKSRVEFDSGIDQSRRCGGFTRAEPSQQRRRAAVPHRVLALTLSPFVENYFYICISDVAQWIILSASACAASTSTDPCNGSARACDTLQPVADARLITVLTVHDRLNAVKCEIAYCKRIPQPANRCPGPVPLGSNRFLIQLM